jgi:hypothetical protein
LVRVTASARQVCLKDYSSAPLAMGPALGVLFPEARPRPGPAVPPVLPGRMRPKARTTASAHPPAHRAFRNSPCIGLRQLLLSHASGKMQMPGAFTGTASSTTSQMEKIVRAFSPTYEKQMLPILDTAQTSGQEKSMRRRDGRLSPVQRPNPYLIGTTF